MMQYSHKTALITGASRGLGQALARALARRGWKLVIDARGDGALEKVRADLATMTQFIAVSGDVTQEQHRVELVRAVAGYGGLYLLVNNAGALGPSPLPALLDYPLRELEQIYQTNAVAPLALVQALRLHLKGGHACSI